MAARLLNILCIGGWGVRPTGKSISVSCSCRAGGRGEAVWAGGRRFAPVSRPGLAKMMGGGSRSAGMSGCPQRSFSNF